MRLGRLWLADFRNYARAELEAAPAGLTVIVGDNGDGKTNLLEGVAYLATLSSFRGAPAEALVRAGAGQAVVRARVERGGRDVLLEAELEARGRHRLLVNHKPLRRARDLPAALRVTVFSPDDLALIKGGPAERRRYLDDLLVSLRPGDEVLRSDVERIVRQRNALLRQASGGRATPEVVSTLDVWDAKLATTGEALAGARRDLVAALEPALAKAYGQLAGDASEVAVSYRSSWEGPLSTALRAARHEDLRRGLTTVGPHRDELVLALGGLPARSYGSQGEQRSLALALRLGAHVLVTDLTGAPPVLLLDDVFSELDDGRAAALLAHLHGAQALLTTTGPLPDGAVADCTVRVRRGRVV